MRISASITIPLSKRLKQMLYNVMCIYIYTLCVVHITTYIYGMKYGLQWLHNAYVSNTTDPIVGCTYRSIYPNIIPINEFMLSYLWYSDYIPSKSILTGLYPRPISIPTGCILATSFPHLTLRHSPAKFSKVSEGGPGTDGLFLGGALD